MGVRGPIGKATDELAETGRLRPCDHDKRGARPATEGHPTVPAGLAEPGKTLWFQIVDHLQANGLCGEIDSAGIEHCCRTWNLLNQAYQLVEIDPTDKASVAAWKAYSNEWLKLVAKYGMTPLDRLRITVGHDKGSKDEDADLLGD